jgi:ferric-dicitrate binding protein FerR (iron transport regulator)
MKNIESHSDNDTFLAKWLEGELSDKDLMKLVSQDDFDRYLKIRDGLNIYGKLNVPLDDSFKQIQQKIKKKNTVKVRKLYTRWMTAIAASVVFFIGFYNFLGSDSVLLKSDFGQQKTVALLDGSEVILNAKSELSYSKKDWQNNRDVYLNGEAFFKVKKGSKFTVKTKNGDITVLGTQFKVNSNADYFEVVCFKGKVQVNFGVNTQILTPNMAFRKINGNAIEQWKTNINQPTWMHGESTFKSVPLKYVITNFEKQFNIKIDKTTIDDSIIFTGSFNHKNINLALASVFRASDIQYKKIDEKNIILSKN